MNKFIIWGVGRNGKTLFEIIGKSNIVAYIDKYTDRKEYKGIPVISVYEYCNRYKEIPIIISVDGREDEIKKELSNYGNFSCYEYIKEMDDIRKFFFQINKEKFLKKYVQSNTRYFWGKGLFAMLISNYFESINYQITSSDEMSDNTIDFNIVFDDMELYYHKEIEKFKDYHKGKRCFIIGNGPSLTYSDLEVLYQNNEICIGVNGIFKAFKYTNWRPEYYIVSDPDCTMQWKKEMINMEVKYKFIADIAYFFNKNEQRNNLICWHMNLPRKKDEKLKFTDDFAQISYHGYTVIYDGALQLAAYMGFEEVYLIGVDCATIDDGKDHFIEGYLDEEFTNAKFIFEEHLNSYQKTKEYYDSHGIKIFNATRGGALEIFKRVNFDLLF